MNRDFSLIDANFARVREGLRVIEDICRFILRNREHFERLKTLRHELDRVEAAFGWGRIVRGRHGEDIGEQAVVASEYDRASLTAIIRANSARAAQALRALEEFTKLYALTESRVIEDMRYRVYAIELRLLMETPHYWLHLYLTEGIVYPLASEVDEVLWLAAHGSRMIQLRDKASPKAEIYRKAKYLSSFFEKRREDHPERQPPLLIINDYADIAASVPVAGVHLGQADGDPKKVRSMIGSNKIIGVSTHSVEDARAAERSGADYIGV